MVILASKSPRRKELLKKIISSFDIIVSEIDEEKSYIYSPLEAVLDIAKRKGEKVHQDHIHDLVISADTIVVLDNSIIGKPKDEKDAIRILSMLSNRTHTVITAYCLFKENQFIENYVTSEVTFNKLSPQLIKEYVASKSPMDKAGAYGVQDNEKYHIVKEFVGSVTNVMGFPVDEIAEDMKKMN